MAQNIRRPAGCQPSHLRLVHSSPVVWHRPGPRADQDLAESLDAVPDALDALPRNPQESEVRFALDCAKAVRRKRRQRLLVLPFLLFLLAGPPLAGAQEEPPAQEEVRLLFIIKNFGHQKWMWTLYQGRGDGARGAMLARSKNEYRLSEDCEAEVQRIRAGVPTAFVMTLDDD